MANVVVVDVVMPQMGVSVSEGTVTRWRKDVGEQIEPDDTLLEISTDKIDTEVPSPASGVLSEILVREGDTVPVGTVVARIGSEPCPAEPASPGPRTTGEAEKSKAVLRDNAAPAASPSGRGCAPNWAKKAIVSPVVARIAETYRVDPSKIVGTGRRGRVTKNDIVSFLQSNGVVVHGDAGIHGSAARPPDRQVSTPALGASADSEVRFELGVGEAAEPMSAMRRGIGEHIRRSLDTSAHVSSAIEVDMSRVTQIRLKLKEHYESSYGVNPTFLAFIARATVATLQDYPWVNGELRGDSIVTRNYVNLGFAVELAEGKGLIVPVVKNAERLNLLGMARAIVEIARRARNAELTADDIAGGTFTVTNPGGYGTFYGTPVISQPQAAILGTYAIVKRPWVIADDYAGEVITVRSIMNLVLTYDHRLIDGALAGRFLRDIRHRLQDWGEADYG